MILGSAERVAHAAAFLLEREIASLGDVPLGEESPEGEPLGGRGEAGSEDLPEGGAGTTRVLTPRMVDRMTGYRVAFYREGIRRWTVDPPAGPDRVPPHARAELARAGGGAVAAGDGAGSWHAVADGVVFASLARPRTPSLPLRSLLPVLGVALLLAVVAAAVLFDPAAERGGRGAAGPAGRTQTALLVIIPLLAGWAVLGYLERDFSRKVERAVITDLTRAIALVRGGDLGLAPVDTVMRLTRFDATRIRSGAVEETTLAAPALGGELARTRFPPSLAPLGAVRTGDEAARYLAVRQPDGSVLALTTPLPDARLSGLRFRLFLLGLGAALPALLFLILVPAASSGAATLRGRSLQ